VTDNGWIQDPNSTRYAPKSKQSPYDGGVRTPIMIRWPGHWASRESPDLAHSIDLVPTLLTAIGAKIPEGLLGIDLSDEERTRQRSAVYGECFTHNANDLDDPRENLRWRWIVRGEWKLIVPNESIEKGSSEELYHLSSDPLENHNLREEQSAIARDLLRELDQWWK
jgi:uncharacterized sulfatase